MIHPESERITMGNLAVAGELAGSDELDELYGEYLFLLMELG